MPIPEHQLSPHPRAVILTALPIEYQAVRSHLKAVAKEFHPKGTVYERGLFTAGTRTWEVLLARTGANNQNAAREAERAIQYFEPQVALFVGVAGGLKDIRVGDVVAASKVYGYESGKARKEFEPRPDVGESSYSLQQCAEAVAQEGLWVKRILGREPASMPRALVGPLAAGEKILADTRSAICHFLKAQYGDALAVEMEGRGFLAATRANEDVKALVIRGISDLIDSKAEADASGSQDMASRHASALAFAVLADFPVTLASVRRAPGFGETVLSRLQWALEQTKPINNPYALLAFFFLALIGIVTLIPSGAGAILAAVAVLAMLLYGSRSLAAPAAKTWAAVSVAATAVVVLMKSDGPDSIGGPDAPKPLVAFTGETDAGAGQGGNRQQVLVEPEKRRPAPMPTLDTPGASLPALRRGSKPAGAVAPLSDAERYARRCKAKAPQRIGNVLGMMLWGTRRDWDTEMPTPDPTSVLVLVDLDTLQPAGSEVKSLKLEGGQLVASPAGKRVAGVVLQGSSSDGKPVEVAICGAEPSPEDPDIVWYRIEAWNAVAQEWENPCVTVDRVPDPRAFAVAGVWDASGARQDVPGRFTFACENGAIAKCIRWGYKPWASDNGQPLTELHQACTRMARADYCGDGRSHTYEDTAIDFYDRLSLATRTTEASALWDPARGSFEAAWGPDGATCLAHTRDGTAVETVIKECPNRFRTGAAVDLGEGDRCTFLRTDVLPTSGVLRNRSYGVPPGVAPPPTAKP